MFQSVVGDHCVGLEGCVALPTVLRWRGIRIEQEFMLGTDDIVEE